MSSIYKITNLENGKIYIGYTKYNIHDRFKQHVKESLSKTSNSMLHKAIIKYGKEKFNIESIYESKDEDHTLNVMEDFFINEYKDKGFILYNTRPGGSGYSGNSKNKKVKLYNDSFELLNTFESMLSVSRFLSCNPTTVRTACENASQGKSSKISKQFYVCYEHSSPCKKDTSYMLERNRKIKPLIGKSRPEHSEYMKRNPTRIDNTIYDFVHKSGIIFSGSRIALKNNFPDHNISTSELGAMINGRYKSHKGWKLL